MSDTGGMQIARPLSEVIECPVDVRVPDRERDFSASVAHVARSPRDQGVVHGIVARPDRDRRVIVHEAVLDEAEGMVGDNWLARGSSSMPDGRANPESQLTVMSTRVLAAIEPDETRWALAGDQLLVDFDLSIEHLPGGTHILVGETELVISEKPHTGCAKFSGRFGSDALRWINSPEGRDLRFRGVNARVVRGGTVRVGDAIRLA
jgi:MOSC domain-containing protein YiiM